MCLLLSVSGPNKPSFSLQGKVLLIIDNNYGNVGLVDAIGKVAFQRNTQKVTCWPVCAATRLIQVSTIVCPSVAAADLAWSVKSAGCPRNLSFLESIHVCCLLLSSLYMLEWFNHMSCL